MAKAPARIAGHPIHPVLIVVPLGLWVGALVLDVAAVVTGNPLWRMLAFWNVVIGIAGALAAAVPGFVDYLALSGRARRLGTWHMVLNLGAVALFALNAVVRWRVGDDSAWPLALSAGGIAVIAVSGWLGGELVFVERAGVEDAREPRQQQPRRAA